MLNVGKNTIKDNIEYLTEARAKYRQGLDKMEELAENHPYDELLASDITALKTAIDGINGAIKGLFEALEIMSE